MEQISQYLKRFKKLLKSEYAVKEIVREAVFEILGVELERTAISIKGDTAYIKASPSIKSEITIRKTAIIESIKQKGLESVKNIK